MTVLLYVNEFMIFSDSFDRYLSVRFLKKLLISFCPKENDFIIIYLMKFFDLLLKYRNQRFYLKKKKQ